VRGPARVCLHDTCAYLANPTSDCALLTSDRELRADGIRTDHAAFLPVQRVVRRISLPDFVLDTPGPLQL
jgi:hypothetical protein